jgi:hypothetical protein
MSDDPLEITPRDEFMGYEIHDRMMEERERFEDMKGDEIADKIDLF